MIRAVLTLLLALPKLALGQGIPGTIITANMTTNSVSIIDAADGRLIGTVPTIAAPHEVAVSPDGRLAAVSEYGDQTAVGNTILLIDVEQAAMVRRINLGNLKRPHGMRFLPGSQRLVLTAEAAGVIAVLNVVSGAVEDTIPTGARLSHMVALSEDGQRAAVTNVSPGSVSVFDLGKRVRLAIHQVGTLVEGLALTPDGREVWAGGNTSKKVHILDAATGASAGAIDGFGMPYRIAITPDGRLAVVTDPDAERVAIVEVTTRQRVASIEVPPVNGKPGSPQGVLVIPSGTHALVTFMGSEQVAIVDLAQRRIVATYPTGGGADGVGFSSLTVKR